MVTAGLNTPTISAVTRLLRATNFEERLGSAAALDRERRISISQTLGDAVYWLIFLLFLPGVLDTLSLQGLLGPVQSMLDGVLGFLPNLFAALLAGKPYNEADYGATSTMMAPAAKSGWVALSTAPT